MAFGHFRSRTKSSGKTDARAGKTSSKTVATATMTAHKSPTAASSSVDRAPRDNEKSQAESEPVNEDAQVRRDKQSPVKPQDERSAAGSSGSKSSHSQYSSHNVSSSYSATERSQASASQSHSSSHRQADGRYRRRASGTAILHHDYLHARRGVLKKYEKKYYFLLPQTSSLYCSRDETNFNLWRASGRPISETSPADGVSPSLVCKVLMARDPDRVGGRSTEASASGDEVRATASKGGSALFEVVTEKADGKRATFKYMAKSVEHKAQWLEALQSVQMMGPINPPVQALDTEASDKVADNWASPNCQRNRAATVNKSRSTRSQSTNERINEARRKANKSHLPDKTTHTADAKDQVESIERSATESTEKVPRKESDSKETPTTSTATKNLFAYMKSRRAARSDASTQKTESVDGSSESGKASSVKSSDAILMSATDGTSKTSNGNVLLFVPAAGSNMSLSDQKREEAQKELETLVAQGAKLPERRGLPSDDEDVADFTSRCSIQWKYGLPDFLLTDLAYIKGKERDGDSTPLESYVEGCLQTFIMEISHKHTASPWSSIHPDKFYMQVNDGPQVSASNLKEEDFFGMLFLRDCLAEVSDREEANGENVKDPRALLSEALSGGFPMEVLQVYTQPPQCYFSWRHWGPYSGHYNAIKGDGSRVEVRGFGMMSIEESQMHSLQLFFKPKELFDRLQLLSVDVQKRVHPSSNRMKRASSAASSNGTRSRHGSSPALPTKKTLSSPSPHHSNRKESGNRKTHTVSSLSKAKATEKVFADLENLVAASVKVSDDEVEEGTL